MAKGYTKDEAIANLEAQNKTSKQSLNKLGEEINKGLSENGLITPRQRITSEGILAQENYKNAPHFGRTFNYTRSL